MALGELLAGLSRPAKSTQCCVQDLLDEAGILQGSCWASVRRTEKGVAAARLRDSADVKDDVVERTIS